VICAFSVTDGQGEVLSEPDLAAARPGAWTWTHLRLGDVRALALLKTLDGLPEEALDLFVAGETRVQILAQEGWVFGVLPDLERDLSGRPDGPGRLAFAFDASRLVTARLHPLSAVDDLRLAVGKGDDAFVAPADAIVAHVEFYLDRVESVLEELAQQMAGVEDYVLTQPQSPRDGALSGLRRTVARYRRELQGLRSALVRTQAGRRPTRRIAAFAEDLPELIAGVEDLDHDAGVLQERGRLLHEEIDTLINGATNRSMRTLTIVSTLLIPPTLITGAFGMNVPGIPFEHSPSGFFVAALLCAAVVGGAMLLIRRLGM
jgi:zinc transporter